MANKPPVFKIPPAPAKAGNSTGAAFNAYINAHPSMRPYADQIWKWAKTYGVDQVVAAALFWRESFAAAKAQGKDPATIVSPAGAVGIGQIMPLHVGEKTPWGHTVTQTDLVNPEFNIRWSMWYFGEQQAKYGSADAAYNQGYNPGYPGAPLTSLLPKGYVPRSGLSPTDKGTVSAETTAATAAAKAQVFDKWAVLDAKGNVKFISIVDPSKPPKNVLDYGGSPLTQSGFVKVWKNYYADTFFAYTGRAAKGAEIKQIMGDGISIYTLANQLTKDKSFVGSPSWNQHAPGIIEQGRQVLGDNWKPSKDFVAHAIAQNWDPATLYAHFKQLPAYQHGPEFQTKLTQNTDAFEQIYGKGVGDAAVAQSIKQKTLDGWTPTEFQSWLRSQPAYKSSPEYRDIVGAVMGQNGLGLITGQQATLSGDQVDQMLNTPRQAAQVPYSSAGSQGRSNGA